MSSSYQKRHFQDIKLISRKEFAKHLDVEENTLRAFFLKHQIPTRRVCGQVLFLMSDLLEKVPAETQKRDPSKARGPLTGRRVARQDTPVPSDN